MTAMIADGFDNAILGIAERCGDDNVLAYDAAKCIEILVEEHDMSHEEAVEYFSFNVSGAYIGKGTPIFVWTQEPTDALERVNED